MTAATVTTSVAAADLRPWEPSPGVAEALRDCAEDYLDMAREGADLAARLQAAHQRLNRLYDAAEAEAVTAAGSDRDAISAAENSIIDVPDMALMERLEYWFRDAFSPNPGMGPERGPTDLDDVLAAATRSIRGYAPDWSPPAGLASESPAPDPWEQQVDARIVSLEANVRRVFAAMAGAVAGYRGGQETLGKQIAAIGSSK